MADLVTLDDAMAELNMTSTVYAAELQGVIDAASEIVENIVGPVSARSVTDFFPQQYGSTTLMLTRTPLVSVQSITAMQWGVVTITYQPSQLIVDTVRGTVRLLRFPVAVPFIGDVTVTYTVGRSSVPLSVRLGTLELVRHLWETQRGQSSARPSYDQGEPAVPAASFAVPNRVRELLAPYEQGPRVG